MSAVGHLYGEVNVCVLQLLQPLGHFRDKVI